MRKKHTIFCAQVYNPQLFYKPECRHDKWIMFGFSFHILLELSLFLPGIFIKFDPNYRAVKCHTTRYPQARLVLIQISFIHLLLKICSQRRWFSLTDQLHLQKYFYMCIAAQPVKLSGKLKYGLLLAGMMKSVYAEQGS